MSKQKNLPPFSYLVIRNKRKFAMGGNGLSTLTLPCGRTFCHSGDLDLALITRSKKGGYLLLFGLILDLTKPDAGAKKIAKALFSDLEKGYDIFLKHIDQLSGRWITIFRESDTSHVRIMGDATHMLKINYDVVSLDCSSNIFVLKGEKLVYREEFVKQRHLWKYGSLGNLSPAKGVKILTPNHTLDMDDGRVDRFFPRPESVHPLSTENVAREVLRLCRRQAEVLRRKYTLFSSLTAGIDSRFSLALAGTDKRRGDIFFTYLFRQEHMVDALVGDHVAKLHGLKHYTLSCRDIDSLEGMESLDLGFLMVEPNLALQKEVSRWVWYSHMLSLVNAYRVMIRNHRDSLPPLARWKIISRKKPLHIRSNLYEIGRCFWGRKSLRECHNSKDILRMSRPDWAKQCAGIFEKFFEETSLGEDFSYGVDLLDLFYWEHRCGTWVSEILQETDHAFNTHAFVNCRHIISLLLSIPFEDRVKDVVFRHVIHQELPRLSGFPINPSLDFVRKQFSDCR